MGGLRIGFVCGGALCGCVTFRISCNVTVLVCDANDNCPRFTKSAMQNNATISEVSYTMPCLISAAVCVYSWLPCMSLYSSFICHSIMLPCCILGCDDGSCTDQFCFHLVGMRRWECWITCQSAVCTGFN